MMFTEVLADPTVISAAAGLIVAVLFALLVRYVPAAWIATLANLIVMIIKALRPRIKRQELDDLASEIVKRIEEELGDSNEIDEEQIIEEVKNQLKKS